MAKSLNTGGRELKGVPTKTKRLFPDLSSFLRPADHRPSILQVFASCSTSNGSVKKDKCRSNGVTHLGRSVKWRPKMPGGPYRLIHYRIPRVKFSGQSRSSNPVIISQSKRDGLTPAYPNFFSTASCSRQAYSLPGDLCRLRVSILPRCFYLAISGWPQ